MSTEKQTNKRGPIDGSRVNILSWFFFALFLLIFILFNIETIIIYYKHKHKKNSTTEIKYLTVAAAVAVNLREKEMCTNHLINKINAGYVRNEFVPNNIL